MPVNVHGQWPSLVLHTDHLIGWVCLTSVPNTKSVIGVLYVLWLSVTLSKRDNNQSFFQYCFKTRTWIQAQRLCKWIFWFGYTRVLKKNSKSWYYNFLGPKQQILTTTKSRLKGLIGLPLEYLISVEFWSAVYIR